MTRPRKKHIITLAVILAVIAAVFAFLEPHARRFDAQYVGSDTCGECHTIKHAEWLRSPHANMTRESSSDSVVGNFVDGEWTVPVEARMSPLDSKPAARMYKEGDSYYMALRHPERDQFVPFEIAFVVGYQYRQVYITREEGGVLRRLPLQWSVERQEFFPYWNLQEGTLPTVDDLWAQTTSMNSAWNLYCAQCHTTHLNIVDKDEQHTRAEVDWIDNGIACEACHGPGSLHTEYFSSNYANRFAAFLNSKIRGRPVAYIANAKKLDKGRAMSVCGRCHGADIFMTSREAYRQYEPGYSREGRINDLSPYFYEAPLEPGRTVATVEVYHDGEPKGIGMLFRSLIESQCYQQAEIRCFDCHNPHDNKQPAVAEILQPSEASNAYCLDCHQSISDRLDTHTRHEPGLPGSFCYDCHMPKSITKLATGIWQMTRTHDMSSIPQPGRSAMHGLENSPNACSDCHSDKSPASLQGSILEWYENVSDATDLTR
jgi:hypothetical protein